MNLFLKRRASVIETEQIWSIWPYSSRDKEVFLWLPCWWKVEGQSSWKMSTLCPTEVMSRRYRLRFRRCTVSGVCMMCFTETCWNQNISDSIVDIPGFTLTRPDREAKASGKKNMCPHVEWTSSWCQPINI